MPKLIKKVDIKIEREIQVNNALQLIAETYASPERVIYEYIQNSVDSAHELRIKNRGKFPYPINIRINRDTVNKTFYIYDNCTGMPLPVLEGLASDVLESKKKNLPWAIGKFGYGIHSFRAFFRAITFWTRNNPKDSVHLISFKRDKIKDNELMKLSTNESSFFKFPTGTIVRLLNFDTKKGTFKSINQEKLQREIELHFENILREPMLSITITENNIKSIKCKSFDYDSIDGEFIKKKMMIIFDSKKYYLDICLKVVDKPMKEWFPRFTCKNVRINEIASCRSFMKISKNPELWSDPHLIGYIEVNDFISPQLERSEFPAGDKRDVLYEKVIELETEIKDKINKIKEGRKSETLKDYGDLLSGIFAQIAKEEELSYREALREIRKGEKAELFVTGEGGASLIGEGGPGEGDAGIGGTGGVEIGTGLGFGTGDEGEGIGKGKGGSGIDVSEDKGDTPAKKRRASGLNIEFRNLGKEETDEMSVKEENEIGGYTIVINDHHPRFLKRISTDRIGNVEITDARLAAYCAQLISTYYVQLRNEKNKTVPTHINDGVYFDFTVIVCRAEELLYENRYILKKLIKNKDD